MSDTDFDPSTESKHKRLKLDWTVSVGNLISIAGAAMVIVMGWNAMDKRVLVLEEGKIVQAQRDNAQDAATIDRLRDIKDGIKDVKEGVNELRRDQQVLRNAKP